MALWLLCDEAASGETGSTMHDLPSGNADASHRIVVDVVCQHPQQKDLKQLQLQPQPELSRRIPPRVVLSPVHWLGGRRPQHMALATPVYPRLSAGSILLTRQTSVGCRCVVENSHAREPTSASIARHSHPRTSKPTPQANLTRASCARLACSSGCVARGTVAVSRRTAARTPSSRVMAHGNNATLPGGRSWFEEVG